MKYFKNSQLDVFAFEDDGSQDTFICPDLIAISEADADTLRAPPAVPVLVPASVTPRQGVEMLIEADLYDTVVAYLDAIPGKEGVKARNRFARANEFRRDDPLVIAIATAQGMTSEQIDQMFVEAAQYE